MDVHVWTHYGPMLVVTGSSAGVWTQRSGAVDTSGPVWTQSWNLEVWTQRRSRTVVTAAALDVDTTTRELWSHSLA
jgi:hypothetical protein